MSGRAEEEASTSIMPHCVAGMAGRVGAETFKSPFDLLKKLRDTWNSEGVRGVWRGYPAGFLGIATYVAGYFVIYEGARRAIEQRSLLEGHPTVTHLLAGGLGGGLTAVLATPFDTIKVRMQTKVYVTAAEPFPSLRQVTMATLREAGVGGLMRGATYRFASNAPSGAIMFAVYESGYRWIEQKMGYKSRAVC